MQLCETSFSEIKLFQPKVFSDNRGYFFESFRKDSLEQFGIISSFVQDNEAKSTRDILRGLHYQLKFPQGKLVRVVSGEVFDVAVDIRYGSPSFGNYFGTILSCENHRVMFVPEGFAHGYIVFSKTAVFQYKCTNYFHSDDQYGIRWNDPDLNIDWKVNLPVLSEKDQRLPFLKNIKKNHLPRYNV